MELLINLLIVFYFVGVLGCNIAGFSLLYRFLPQNLKKSYLVVIGSLIPVGNYILMWEAFKLYHEHSPTTIASETLKTYKRFEAKMGNVTHRKGLSYGRTNNNRCHKEK